VDTSRKNLVPRDLFLALLNQHEDALVIADDNYRPYFWNEKAELLFSTTSNNFSTNQLLLEKIKGKSTSGEMPMVETEVVWLSSSVPFEKQQFHRTIETLEINSKVWRLIRFTEITNFYLTESELLIQSRTDDLSQLLNRRGFRSTLEQNIEKRLALAILDIDYFKRINDNYGHAAGDRAIAWFAEQLNSEFSDAICIGRLGGDEFGVVEEVVDATKTKLRFQDFCETISRQQLKFYTPGITISIGVAISSLKNIGSRRLLTAGDQAMYQSKQNGRNQSTNVELT
jgi:diguanylate cyclase (GGDEF)-like protein